MRPEDLDEAEGAHLTLGTARREGRRGRRGGGREGGWGSGGGALLLASSTRMLVNGTNFPSAGLFAVGGRGRSEVGSFQGGHGSGGALRLVAPGITVGPSAVLFATPPSGTAGLGRIRLEAESITLPGTGTTSVNPPPSTSTPGPVFAPASFPSLRIAKVAGVSAPANPVGSFTAQPDVTLPLGILNPVPSKLAGSNPPLAETAIQVRVTPQGAAASTATSTGLSGTPENSTATASVTLPTGTSLITASATFAAAGGTSLGSPLMIAGEEVKQIRVGATFGGPSTLTYLLASGREVAAPSASGRPALQK